MHVNCNAPLKINKVEMVTEFKYLGLKLSTKSNKPDIIL